MAANATGTSQTIEVPEGGVQYEVKVTSLSQHLPSDEVKEGVIVNGT